MSSHSIGLVSPQITGPATELGFSPDADHWAALAGLDPALASTQQAMTVAQKRALRMYIRTQLELGRAASVGYGAGVAGAVERMRRASRYASDAKILGKYARIGGKLMGPLGVGIAIKDVNDGRAGVGKPLAYAGVIALGAASTPAALTVGVALAILDAAGVIDDVSLNLDESIMGD